MDSLSSGQAPLKLTFFVAVKSFHANVAISGNFVLNAKKLECIYGMESTSHLLISFTLPTTFVNLKPIVHR